MANRKCMWSQEEDESETYSTSCLQMFELNDGTPEDNGFNYCFSCGKEIVQFLYEDRGEQE